MVGNFTQLTVYKKAFKLAMDRFETGKSFPKEEIFSLRSFEIGKM